MADISQIKLPDGNTYDLKVLSDHYKPIMSKTYTGVIGTTNSFTQNTWYFGKIRPDDYNVQWNIKYRIHVEAAGSVYAKATADVGIFGARNYFNSYYSFNQITNTSYRPCYYHVLYRLNEVGFNNGYSHLLGEQIYNSWNAITAANSRTFTIDILECTNCTFEFLDDMVLYEDVEGNGTTNYEVYSQFDFCNQGLMETGDANDANYQNRLYYSNAVYTVSAKTARNVLFLTQAENVLLPITSVDNAPTNLSKEITDQEFDPFGQIYYYATSTIRDAGTKLTANAVLYQQNYTVDLRYSLNIGSTLVTGQPVYLVAVPQRNGMAKLHTTPVTQTEPTTEDGLIYIRIGQAISTTNIELYLIKNVYQYRNGAFRQWFGETYWQYNSTDDTIELVFPT